MLAIPFIGMLTGFGFAFMGQWFSGIVPSIDSFSYVQSALVTPLLLVSGVFFPITGFPAWVQSLAQLNPLYHCVELVRHAVFGWDPAHDVVSVLVLCVFAAVMGMLAVRVLRRCLID